jgi:hypothetical protein
MMMSFGQHLVLRSCQTLGLRLEPVLGKLVVHENQIFIKMIAPLNQFCFQRVNRATG